MEMTGKLHWLFCREGIRRAGSRWGPQGLGSRLNSGKGPLVDGLWKEEEAQEDRDSQAEEAAPQEPPQEARPLVIRRCRVRADSSRLRDQAGRSRSLCVPCAGTCL